MEGRTTLYFKSLTKEEAESYLIKNGGPKLDYINKDVKQEHFYFDGEKVVLLPKLRKKSFEEYLLKVVHDLNTERFVRCPFTGFLLPLSHMVQGYEYFKFESHMSHKRHFSQEILFFL